MNNHLLKTQMIHLLDLTSLNESDTERTIRDLCRHAQTPKGNVAAVCVYPEFIRVAKQSLLDSAIKVATVANFPSGLCNSTNSLNEVDFALNAGADEVDVVFPYHEFLRGEFKKVLSFLQNIRSVDHVFTLKIIIETGALSSETLIKHACTLAIEAGTNFLKTSTGKIPVGATINAASSILEAIQSMQAEETVGLKISGGIRTFQQASEYIALTTKIMGEEWVSPSHFRIGASGLLDQLLI